MDKESVKLKSKKIMDDFLESLEKVNREIKKKSPQNENTRKDLGLGKDKEFIKTFNKNFPNKEKDKLIVEKKDWDNE